MSWLKERMSKSAFQLDFQSFVQETLDLSNMSTFANPGGIYFLDKHDYFMKPDQVREIMSQYIATFTNEEEQARLMQEGGAFKIIPSGNAWTVTFNDKPFNINLSLMLKIMMSGHSEFIRISNQPPRNMQVAIEDRQRRMREGPPRVQRVDRESAPTLDVTKMSSEAKLRYANIAGWLMKTTVYYLDEPQVKKKRLPDDMILKMRRKQISRGQHPTIGPGATLRDLDDNTLVGIYWDLISDYQYGDNSSGFNPSRRRAWPQLNALNTVFDRRTFQPHLEVHFQPPHFTAESLEQLIGPLSEQTTEEGQMDPRLRGLTIAWKHSIAAFADNFGISGFIPVRLEKGFEIDRLLERMRKGESAKRKTLDEWGATETSKNYILSQVGESEQESISVFFDFGQEGNLDFDELKSLVGGDAYEHAASSWTRIFKP